MLILKASAFAMRMDKAYLNEGLLFQKEGFGGRAVTYDIYEIDLAD